MSKVEKEIPLPDKEEGAHKDIEVHEKAHTSEQAKHWYESAKSRLLDVNNWDKICGKASAVFKLTDDKGNEIEETPKVGYHFKINIPAPGGNAGEGYDWVRVEAIEENEDKDEDKEYLVMRVRPSDNPATPNKEVAHFFSEKSTSNFVVMREKKVVTAAVIGRNEVPNTKSTDNLFDKIRNALVGTGAVGGFSYPQWKSLVKGILNKE